MADGILITPPEECQDDPQPGAPFGYIYWIDILKPDGTLFGFYVGSTVDPERREEDHWKALFVRQDHSCCALQVAAVRFGLLSINFRIVEIIENVEGLSATSFDNGLLREIEQEWIDGWKLSPLFLNTSISVWGPRNPHWMRDADEAKLAHHARQVREGRRRQIEAFGVEEWGRKMSAAVLRHIEAIGTEEWGRRRSVIMQECVERLGTEEWARLCGKDSEEHGHRIREGRLKNSTFEQRSETSRQTQLNMAPEVKAAAQAKGWVTRRERYGETGTRPKKNDPAGAAARSAAARRAKENMTPQQRSEATRKGAKKRWETRRARFGPTGCPPKKEKDPQARKKCSEAVKRAWVIRRQRYGPSGRSS